MGRNQFPPRYWNRLNETLGCGKCNSIKPYSEFSSDKKSKSSYGYWCKTCVTANARRCHKLNTETKPEYVKQKRNGWIKKAHGITLQKYLEKLATQDYLCAICKVKLLTSGHRTHLDHDHTTGKLRDFLCTNCNRGLGHFKDSSKLLKIAANYLNTHNSSVDTIKEVTRQ